MTLRERMHKAVLAADMDSRRQAFGEMAAEHEQALRNSLAAQDVKDPEARRSFETAAEDAYRIGTLMGWTVRFNVLYNAALQVYAPLDVARKHHHVVMLAYEVVSQAMEHLVFEPQESQ